MTMPRIPEAVQVIAAVLCVVTVLLANGALTYKNVRSCDFWSEPKRLIILSMAMADVVFALFALNVLYLSPLLNAAASCGVTSLAYIYCLLLNCVCGLGTLSLGFELWHRRKIGKSTSRIRCLTSFLLSGFPWVLGLGIVLPLCLGSVELGHCEFRESLERSRTQIAAAIIVPACAAVLVCVVVQRGFIQPASVDKHWDDTSRFLTMSKKETSCFQAHPDSERSVYSSLPTLQALSDTTMTHHNQTLEGLYPDRSHISMRRRQNLTNITPRLARHDLNCDNQQVETNDKSNRTSMRYNHTNSSEHMQLSGPSTSTHARLSTFNMIQHSTFNTIQQSTINDSGASAQINDHQSQIYYHPQPTLSNELHQIYSNPNPNEDNRMPLIYSNPNPNEDNRTPQIYSNPNPNEDNRTPQIYSNPNPNEDNRTPQIYSNPNPNEDNRTPQIYSNPNPKEDNRTPQIYINPNPNEDNRMTLIYSNPNQNEDNRKPLIYSNPNPNEDNRTPKIFSNPNPNEDIRTHVIYNNPNPNEENRTPQIYSNPNPNEDNRNPLIYSNPNPNEDNRNPLIYSNPNPNEDNRTPLIYSNPNPNEDNRIPLIYSNPNANVDNRTPLIYSNPRPTEDRILPLVYDHPQSTRTSFQRSLILSTPQSIQPFDVQSQIYDHPPQADTAKLRISKNVQLAHNDGWVGSDEPPLSSDIIDYQPRLFFDLEPVQRIADTCDEAAAEKDSVLGGFGCHEEKGRLCCISIVYLVYVIVLTSVYIAVSDGLNRTIGLLVMVIRSNTTPILLYNYSQY